MTASVFAQTNQVRYNAGRNGLVRNAALDKVAAAWAYQQWKNGSMSHNPSYSKQIPKGWTRAGENVAKGYTYTQVVGAWVASPSHYANLVNDYTSVGIGFYEANGKRYWSQVFAKYPGTKVPARPAALRVRPDVGLPGRTGSARRHPHHAERAVVREERRRLDHDERRDDHRTHDRIARRRRTSSRRRAARSRRLSPPPRWPGRPTP